MTGLCLVFSQDQRMWDEKLHFPENLILFVPIAQLSLGSWGQGVRSCRIISFEGVTEYKY